MSINFLLEYADGLRKEVLQCSKQTIIFGKRQQKCEWENFSPQSLVAEKIEKWKNRKINNKWAETMAMCGAEPRGIVCRRCLCGFLIITRSLLALWDLQMLDLQCHNITPNKLAIRPPNPTSIQAFLLIFANSLNYSLLKWSFKKLETMGRGGVLRKKKKLLNKS